MADKGVVGHVGTVEDVTERRRAEDAMRANEQRLEQLMQLLPAAVYTCDMEGRITFYNRRAVELWGGELDAIERRRFCGSHALRRLDGDALPHEQTPMAVSLREGRSIRNEEAVVIRPDGSEVVVSVNVDPLLDEEGQQCGAINVLQDITALKNTQAALEEGDRRKDQFLAMLAHELRNPLAPIRNAAQILSLVGPANPQLRFTQDIINRQVAHLSRLVDDLLDVSRITQGKVSLDKERVAVATIIGRAVETVRPLLEARQHRLTVSVAPEAGYVEGDLTRLAQVLANVIHNAAKYTESGGQVEIVTESGHGEMVIWVRDTGIGIPPEFLPHVFDLFAQAGRSLDRTQGGLGVGLTLARDLVHLHGGRIEVRSAGAGRGTEVAVRLPTIAEPRKESNGSGMRKPDLQGQRAKILVVDDNVDSAESLTLLFRLQGQDVETAFDGPSALQLATKSCPNIVLLDIGLPGMDGYEVARLLRQNPTTANTTIIALTGYGQEEDRRRSKEAGIDHHLTKPVDLDVLQNLVRSIFRKGAVA
jgi:PAS domain S-box-containing protein